jgi:ATP-dependent Lon protease
MKERKKRIIDASERELLQFPLLPLREMVIFPHMVIPLFVGRERSILALEAAMSSGRTIFLATQRNAETEEPAPDEICQFGTVCQIVQLLKLPDGTVKVLVEGKQRGSIDSFLDDHRYLVAKVAVLHEPKIAQSSSVKALMRNAAETFQAYQALSKNSSAELLSTVESIEHPGTMADTIVANLSLKLADKQDILAIVSPLPRLKRLVELLAAEVEVLQLEKRIRSRVKKQMEKSQREYYLNEQLKAIHKELGSKDEQGEEFRRLEEGILAKEMSAEAREKALHELKKMKLMSPASAEAAVIRNYIETLIALPWRKLTKEQRNVVAAEAVLADDHFGLDKVKERILEYLAVLSLSKQMKGPILCLVGPPGVGKTSLARSIARATGRRFVKMSLGGMRDEAEIRGHRRTYVGAMPGKIMVNLRKAESDNPVFLLDEIDKLSADFRGDPASALLEVLDPEQNAHFSDHFLDIEYDLSRVMFVATANSTHSIPRPLLDRMEVVQLSGYTESEKFHIARNYLICKQVRANGLGELSFQISDRALLGIIRYYTREAGVRGLEREIAALCRKIARKVVRGEVTRAVIHPRQLPVLLGPHRFKVEQAGRIDVVGVVSGLAWTEAGGDLLQVEVSIVPGKGKLIITGKLGDVMSESAQAAMTYARSRAQWLGIDPAFFQTVDIHIHAPEGAIPKDGPSAGIAMATAIISAMTGRPVRHEVAMTGEITLQGRVLPIGGLKEKVLAAVRGGIKTVLVPSGNRKDLAELPGQARRRLIIRTVDHMDQVIGHALRDEACPDVPAPPPELAVEEASVHLTH